MSSEKIIVLYERLSREDENLGESYSISNQKKLLEDYCREKGWTRFRHFTDDGISGTTFDRPSFKAMIQLVEDGEVETIILKDMSRLGRDYLVVGQLREFFRKKGVRLIAINDNHDSYFQVLRHFLLHTSCLQTCLSCLTIHRSLQAVYQHSRSLSLQ